MPNRNDFLDMDDEALLRLCREACFRASGPGGQHRNKTDSAVRLSLLDGAVMALCTEHRSQHRNRAEALRRLRIALAMELRLPVLGAAPDKPTKPCWKLGRKDRRYAAFIAQLLDVLAYHDWAVGAAAETLGTSTGKLIRTLSRDPHLWNAVNKERAKLGLVNLRQP
jgi:hypothetical protein